MSADYWLETDNCHAHHSVNVTYNLGKMLREAGHPEWQALKGAPASEVAGVMDAVARTLRSDPDRFRAFNPPNGWGTYEGAIEYAEAFRDMCSEHPEATVAAWL